MTEGRSQLTINADELRRAFDESFAAAPQAPPSDLEDFLAISAGSGHYALRIVELAGLAAGRSIAPLPSADPAFLGLAGSGGRLVPVYRLAALIGSATGEEESNWLAICGKDEPVALAFAAVDGHLRVPRSDLYQPAGADRQHVREAIRIGDEPRLVLDVPSLLASIRQRAGIAAL